MSTIVNKIASIIDAIINFISNIRNKEAYEALDTTAENWEPMYHAWIIVEDEFNKKENITVAHGTRAACEEAIKENMFKLNNHKILGWRIRLARV